MTAHRAAQVPNESLCGEFSKTHLFVTLTQRKTMTRKTTKAAKTKPAKPVGPLTQGQLGALLGTSQQRVSQLLKEGLFSALKNGRIDPFIAVPAYCRAIRKVPDAGMSRIRDLRAQELEARLAKERNESISLDDVNYAVGMIVSGFCGELAGVAAASTRDLGQRETIQGHLSAAIYRFKASLDAVADDAKAGRLNADDAGGDDDEA
ncbi:hypothetical protein [Bradyrhizobium sp. S3.9.1]|uniref:hypothetical protein n=1 Tax=Bradyrhizobium sp. S3.9.1 TaxID=3156431 RepID=UPI0033949BD3